MNIVATTAVLKNGMKLPLFWRIWRKEENVTGRERFVPVKPATLIKEAFIKLITNGEKNKISAIAIPGIYIKLPYKVVGKRGKEVSKYRYTLIAAIAAVRLTEDIEKMQYQFEKNKDNAATYRGAYLLISNRVDNPEGALAAYTKRWSIEVFFRTAKQELGLNCCHSTSESHHYAHIELLFTAETLLAYAR